MISQPSDSQEILARRRRFPNMQAREKRDINPVLLKFGVALALSFAGFLFSRFRTRRIKSSPPPPSPRSSDQSSDISFDGGGARSDTSFQAVKATSASCDTISVPAGKFEETCTPKVSVDSMAGLSPSSKIAEDKDGLFSQEINDLVKGFELAAANADFSSNEDNGTTEPSVETPRFFRNDEKDEYEQEIRQLRNMVQVLQERERKLEIELLEYYGLKEQETAVMELKNRLKLNNMEAKLFTLKIESLQAENQRLEAQVADHAKVAAELEAAKGKIRLLKKKLRSEAEQNKEQILALQQRVSKLIDQEYKADPSEPNVQLNLQRLKDLEVEAEELRKSNARLRVENAELSRRLESTQVLANSVLEDPEAETLKMETEHLRRKNEDLEKEIEKLESYRCSDTEELVYLKWINACLRYELRNYNPPDGKTVARDLSRTLSLKSEEKAKQLILEYANTEWMGERGINLMELDYDQWSSSQNSFLTESGEFDDSSIDNSSATKTNSSSKIKFFTKLRRIIRGKDSQDHLGLSVKSESTEDGESSWRGPNISRGMHSGTEGHSSRIATSMDLHGFSSVKGEHVKDIDRRKSDGEFSHVYKRFVLGNEGSERNLGNTQHSELVKYAEALKDSHGGTTRVRKISASVSLF